MTLSYLFQKRSDFKFFEDLSGCFLKEPMKSHLIPRVKALRCQGKTNDLQSLDLKRFECAVLASDIWKVCRRIWENICFREVISHIRAKIWRLHPTWPRRSRVSRLDLLAGCLCSPIACMFLWSYCLFESRSLGRSFLRATVILLNQLSLRGTTFKVSHLNFQVRCLLLGFCLPFKCHHFSFFLLLVFFVVL